MNEKQRVNRKKLNKSLDKLFLILGFSVTLLALGILLTLILDIVQDGWGRLNLDFLTHFPSRKPQEAGILSAWVGTLWIMTLTSVIAFPLGVMAGIYLEEYAPQNRITNLIEINIANLAGVPSIIYGLLGLGLFVRFMHMGRSVISGGATLALLILPMIILSTREALRAVPFSIREAAYAIGATKWQTVRHQVLPSALPGIMTGTILAMSRAIGETAPLIMIGALTYIAFLPAPPLQSQFPFLHLNGLFDPFTVLPIQIFNWVSRPQKGFFEDAAAGIIILLGIAFLMNAVAIFLRTRYQKKIRW
ncbi:MAG: phosphate ABC transporter permease PstA [Chlamydiae bacterium]|nr:phosphate ABC transporter permease PstA [Chlamydiota bacterium]MBI3266967.1 phosphate ABC transporter permease PstA [Chlamydiota bacterium]